MIKLETQTEVLKLFNSFLAIPGYIYIYARPQNKSQVFQTFTIKIVGLQMKCSLTVF